MYNFMKIFNVDLKKNILSPKFLAGVFLIFFLCLLSDAPIISSRNPLSVFDEIIKYRYEYWLKNGAQFCNLSIIYNFDNSLWYSIVLPVIATFPIICNLNDELTSNNYMMVLSRCGYTKYIFSKILSAFATGVFVIIIGLSIYSTVILITFPSINEYTDKSQLFFCEEYSNIFQALYFKVLNNSLLCGEYGAFSIFLYLLLSDNFYTMIVMLLINYFSMKIEAKFINNTELFLENSNYKFQVLFPNAQTNMYIYIPSYYNISFYWYIVITSTFIVIFSLLSFYLLRRIYKNG